MIKIEPFIATDSTQIRALLRHQDELLPYESFCAEEKLFNSGYFFWQHWLPCRYHLAPATYVAKENGVILGLISIASQGKANSCWHINHLVVHPNHRGSGIAQKLLQYVFALFGSQGVSHFVMEISCQNAPALSLLAGLGFRRAARLVHYQMPSESHFNASATENEQNTIFRWAQPTDRELLFQLFQDSLPSDLRMVYAPNADDFNPAPIATDSGLALNRLVKLKSWYWVAHNIERNVLVAAIKVTTHRTGDFHVEFIVHPGWQNMAKEAVNYAMQAIKTLGMEGVIIAKAYDFQAATGEALQELNWQRNGEFVLLVKEHWLRIKKRSLKIDTSVNLPGMAKPAINLPYQIPPAADV